MQPASQITCWWPAQRLALNTKAQYRSLLIHHVLPTFGDRPLASITSPEQIAAWEIALYEQPQPPGGKPLSVNSARKCRKLLALILSDAVTADLVTRNAARVPRRRGMAASEARPPLPGPDKNPGQTRCRHC